MPLQQPTIDIAVGPPRSMARTQLATSSEEHDATRLRAVSNASVGDHHPLVTAEADPERGLRPIGVEIAEFVHSLGLDLRYIPQHTGPKPVIEADFATLRAVDGSAATPSPPSSVETVPGASSSWEDRRPLRVRATRP